MNNQNIDGNSYQYLNEINTEKYKNNSKDMDINKNQHNNKIMNYDINEIDNIKDRNIIKNNDRINDNININENLYYHNKDYNKYNDEVNNNEKSNYYNINLKTERSGDYLDNNSEHNILFNNKDNSLSNEDNILNYDRIKNHHIKEYDNYSEDIQEKITQTNNESLSNLQNTFNYSSHIQLQDEIKNRISKKERTHSMTLPLKNPIHNLFNNNNSNIDIEIKNNNNYKNFQQKKFEMNNYLSTNSNNNINNTVNDQYLLPFPNLYTLKGNKIISFNLLDKKFLLINPNDNTNGIFNICVSRHSIPPLTLNTSDGFFILLDNYIFLYNKDKNSINILTTLLSFHQEGGFIYINKEIYTLSGKDCLLCEKYSINKRKNINLPSVNYPRINSGLININNEYLYIFFGNNCYNSIERLDLSIDYESMKEYINNWEYIQINSIMENINKISLERFTLFLDDYNNIIIFGGNDSRGNVNQEIYSINLENKEINAIGKIDTTSLYIGQNIQLEESIFAIYDSRNGLHFFNKELDYHEIYNFTI